MDEQEKRLRAMISNQANRLLDVVLEKTRKEGFERGLDEGVRRFAKTKVIP